ncbi:MAG: tetratricopeptide repeat protein [Alphaproteobacteria bacterium]|nr:tetratricopeptide repeat protein [Alphaproteobacteria bacterium]
MKPILFILVCAVAIAGVSSWADEPRDIRLNRLFAELHRTRDIAAGQSLTDRIWDIWHNTGRPETVELMLDGRRALQRQDVETALQRFNEVVKREPDLSEGWNKRATLYFVMGRYRASIADIGKVLELEPRHFGALAGLGMIYELLNQPRKALDAWRRALAANPHLQDAPRRIRQLERDLGQQRI